MARLVLMFLLVAIAGCGEEAHFDANESVPEGDPAFTPLAQSWIVDNAKVIDPGQMKKLNNMLQNLRDDGVAEVVVLIQDGINHPDDYATHYGRWLGLGKRGPSSEGGQNGLVWLIRPGASKKITVSIGRGLPRLTTGDCVQIVEPVRTLLEKRDFNAGVRELVTGTDTRLRQLYGKRKE